LPPKIRKRGRPKGVNSTVIGVPKKKCSDGPVKFLQKSNKEIKRQILDWILPHDLVEKAQRGEKINCKQLGDLNLAPNLLDENVNWAGVQSYFSNAAWSKISNAMAVLEENPEWKCRTCSQDLSLLTSAVCESCLYWYHLKCVGLFAAPKKAVWFCRLCYGDSVKTQDTADNKVMINCGITDV